MTDSTQVGVILSVDTGRFAETIRAARAAGLTVVSEQPLIGTASGTIAEERLPLLRAIDGVEAVERDRTIRLPPPESPVQ
ncbi:hypothetical protein ACFC09_14460 [Streptomyces sp. NPDC056161]|uniref:hypothetical protein n=1 Tax=Streptomyces sp. NPDC056161 TaxID=3345732 RepID=UPI0035DA7290